jgi:hypothetical protein
MARGARIEGVCLYPITAYAGWDNERHCDVGLFSHADALGRRQVFAPLAAELKRQMAHPLFRTRAAGDVAHEADLLEQRFGPEALAVARARLGHAERHGSERLSRRRALVQELARRQSAHEDAAPPAGDVLRWATF